LNSGGKGGILAGESAACAVDKRLIAAISANDVDKHGAGDAAEDFNLFMGDCLANKSESAGQPTATVIL
jgi:hypothetical protein